MSMIEFTVPGQPRGYYASGKRNKWKMSLKQREQSDKYTAYKIEVQRIAKEVGIALPLKATQGDPLYIVTIQYFGDRRHCDPGNVQKGVCDALFYGAKGGGDKHTGGFFTSPKYDKENPRVEVKIISSNFELHLGKCILQNVSV